MRKMIGHVILFTVLMILSIASSSFSASYTTYNNLSSFSSAAGSLLTQNFASYNNDAPMSGVNFLPGVNVTSNMQSLVIAGSDKTVFGFDFPLRSEQKNAYYQINFASPYRAVGFDIMYWEIGDPSGAVDSGVVELLFADNTSAMINLTQTINLAPFFFGVIADTNLTSIKWYEPHEGSGWNEETGLDNFAVGNPITTPEPATMLLLGFGIAGLAGARRFRK